MSTSILSKSLGLKLVIIVVIGNIIGSGVYKKLANGGRNTFIRLCADSMDIGRDNKFIAILELGKYYCRNKKIRVYRKIWIYKGA